MKIALIPPWEEKLPPAKYGGTELVVSNLAEELVGAGHQVWVLATADSKTSAKLIPIFKKPIRLMPDSADQKTRESYKIMGLGKTVEYLRNGCFEIIHNHLGWRLLPFEKIFGAPVITTLHGPLDNPTQKNFYKRYKNSNFTSISFNQRRPMLDLNFVGNVYNGIRVESFKFAPKPKDYFVFLGRMSPQKGPIQAIKIALSAGIKLVMAAKVDSVDKRYFEKEVKPLIDDEQIKFIGEADHKKKNKLLGGAKALIAPIQWEEPFGLYFIEAMACGTPVITLKRGSAPEIILNNRTGFICANEQEMAEKIKMVNLIDRHFCRQYCLENFSSRRMAQNYLNVYEKIIGKSKEPAKAFGKFLFSGRF